MATQNELIKYVRTIEKDFRVTRTDIKANKPTHEVLIDELTVGIGYLQEVERIIRRFYL